MNKVFDNQNVPLCAGYHRVLSILLWLAVFTGWLVSIFSVIQEMCMVTACRDTAIFTIFGVNMGWFGIAYFSLILLLLWLRKKVCWLDWALSAMVFAGIGSEFRLLWIQKYIIGGWCPLCVTICCALFIAAMLLVAEKVQGRGAAQSRKNYIYGWMAFVVTMIATGLVIAIIGVQALT
jgi:hypothetical protein